MQALFRHLFKELSVLGLHCSLKGIWSKTYERRKCNCIANTFEPKQAFQLSLMRNHMKWPKTFYENHVEEFYIEVYKYYGNALIK